MDEVKTSNQWLDREDVVARADRLRRLDWLASIAVDTTTVYLLDGGRESLQLFEESRYCYVYGQYLAVTILGVAFVERMIAAKFYTAGRDDLERAGGASLLRAAVDEGWLTESEFLQFSRLRQLRNPLVHYRRPLSAGTIVSRVLEEDRDIYEILERDAQEVLKATLHVLTRFARRGG